jgi:putative spermidine/putrescine transport system permease protein
VETVPLTAGTVPTRRLTAGERRNALSIAPLLLFVMLAFNLPIVTMLAWSVTNPTPTARHYQYLLEAPVYLRVLGNTLRIAAVTTVVCILLGYPLAYWIRSLSRRGRAIALTMVVLPFWISILIRTYAWIVILGNAGLVNRLLVEIGVIGAPIEFLYNELGVTIGTVNVLLPFFVLPLYAAFTRYDDALFQAAASLGASRRDIFWRLFLPMSLPALLGGASIVFILTLGFFITPAVLGGGKVPMVASMLEVLINTVPRWELAAALSTILMIVVSGLYALARSMRVDSAR